MSEPHQLHLEISPMSYDQPGPYGGQPQQPGPYEQGPPHQPGLYGQGGPQYPGPYGQVPPVPQGAPSQGYGPPQQGPPDAYGPPQQPGHLDPQAPPAPGAGGGKKAWLVVGAVVALAVTGGGIWYLTAGSDEGSGPKNDGPHRLTAPAEVLGGKYKSVTKKADEPRPLDASKANYLAGTGISADSRSVVNVYSAATELHDAPRAEGLTFLGVHGEVADPARTLDAVFAELRQRPNGNFLGAAQAVAPDGLDGAVMKCQKSERETPALPLHRQPTVTCVWADHSTVGVVTPSKPDAVYSVEEAAQLAADLRKAVRVAGR
ncbi:hypothetical protein ACIQM4_26295 [Streptomyces sp. NPDC091272]|uniref:hypothetical protein n=1 Tax=Streptomyces sp. NPDC091272 TaxID=3365981 RepID=UPI003812F06E